MTMKMKLLACLIVVSMLAGLSHEKNLEPGLLDPCRTPEGPSKYPGCQPPGPPQAASPYTRGCSRHHRCRGG
ncbi:hypothetical protein FNV43_RR23014 [Rhamnella rubrinervis]|uniref:Uncharacterized protein n=1 Tax=Rhamnella rubrinervis TaxID=2594499 RepID=A0A8K0E302_9ROSA|nr:hypothetical protein FNV43_RR23014 [Rhamnella rubrinervis]